MVLTPSSMVDLATRCPDFDLPNTDGTQVSRADFVDQPLVVAFICNHCPYVKHIAPRLAEVGDLAHKMGFSFVAISSNDVQNYPDDSPELMVKEAAERGYNFPYLYDESQDVARAFDAQCTPDFFVYDATHKLTYRGQFDGSRPGNGMDVTGESLIAAMHATLEGKEIHGQNPSVGCNIKWKE